MIERHNVSWWEIPARAQTIEKSNDQESVIRRNAVPNVGRNKYLALASFQIWLPQEVMVQIIPITLATNSCYYLRVVQGNVVWQII